MSAAAALLTAAALAGCGGTTYFAGRTLPPSGIANRVMIAVQNPSALSKGALAIVDAYYDIRSSYDSKTASFSVAGYSGSLPTTIQNMPEQLAGAVYNSGDGSLSMVSYNQEKSTGAVGGLSGLQSSVFISRDQNYVIAASQASHVVTVVDKTTLNGGTYTLSLPGVYRVSMNPGGSMVLLFAENSNYAYYLHKLNSAETVAYKNGPSSWPQGAQDCEPQNSPYWCVMQVQDPTTKQPLQFDRPTKAVFSADGSTAYVLNCGPECGGTTASVTTLPVAPFIYLVSQQSGTAPTQATLTANTIAIPGGASNALLSSNTLYVVGQQLMPDKFWGGHLTVLTLPTGQGKASIVTSTAISDGAPGLASRMILADDNTLWIGMQQCASGERVNNQGTYGVGNYGCLTMFNTSTNKVTMIEPYVNSNGVGSVTGIAAVTTLHKVYVAEDGQVYIFSTVDGSQRDNQYVTVSGTAYDVAYIDATTDANNTVY